MRRQCKSRLAHERRGRRLLCRSQQCVDNAVYASFVVVVSGMQMKGLYYPGRYAGESTRGQKRAHWLALRPCAELPTMPKAAVHRTYGELLSISVASGA
jgi:hypothetical protein